MSDDIIGTIEGTATYESVRITRQPDSDRLQVAGEYDGNPEATIYGVEPGHLFVGGLQFNMENGSMTVTIEPPTDNEFVWVEASETELRITKENPNPNQTNND